MDLEIGIKHILDGDAVIIMGAGASYGAKNPFGAFPSGTSLAEELYKKCSIVPDNKNDLQDAAQSFLEKFSAMQLVLEIRSLLQCASFTPAHETIYSLPWIRYYTTNYDDVAILAARQKGVTITPVTINSSIRDNLEKERLCVYINGYIGNLTERTLNNEFKLTANSYLSHDHIDNTDWGNLLVHDLQTAKCIVIVGLSLNYDLDLSRIIYNEDTLNKTIIIDRPDMSANAKSKLGRYGKVYAIGIDTFADEINQIKSKYSPKVQYPLDRLYKAFCHEYKRKYKFEQPSADDVFSLFLNGKYNDPIYRVKDGNYEVFVYRKKFEEIEKAIKGGKRFVFIQSEIGNGKTACINEIRKFLSGEDIHVFTLTNADSTKIREEITSINELAQSCRVVVIIDDYTNYMEILQKFSLLNTGRVQFVLTARTALNYNKMPNVLNIFEVLEDDSAVFDINQIDDTGIKNCIRIFDRYGLFGKIAKLSFKEKQLYLIRRKNGARMFQAIMLDIIESDFMQQKLIGIIQTIEEKSGQYHNAVIIILLIKVMNLRLSVTDIERILGVTLQTDALFRTNPAILELISFEPAGGISIKSPITAQFLLQRVCDPEKVIQALKSVALYAEKYNHTSKFRQVLTTIISYSHIHSFLRRFQSPDEVMLTYYDELSEIDFYEKSNFFWLQYAIACIEMKKFDRAQRYLNTAYGLIPDGFVPFQINNQQARFYLEKIICDQADDPQDYFLKAHRLLMLPITSPNDNEYNVIKLFGYYSRKQMKEVLANKGNLDFYERACREAYTRLDKFLRKHPMYNADLADLKKKLIISNIS